ncbi:energy transducer TonB [Pandoraea sp. ISTKB]|uniref:energy transducer TonB n=1 Tax=Pandoraea sp. ISTKB TaxID=1586708 RepID=UPI0009F2EED7|nr:energy transducer TonB [Pandoraea sp. ISTKB]
MSKWSITRGGAIVLVCLAGCETGRVRENAVAVEEQSLTAASPQSPNAHSRGERTDAERAGSRASTQDENFSIVLGKGAAEIRLRCTIPAHGYPEAARQLQFEGTAKVRIVMNANGQVQRTTLVESSGHEMLDVAALDTLDRMRCQVKTNGGPVEQGFVFLKPMIFELR